ncbi:hypothetical protein ACFQFQ_10675 [Sulfitobacter porphyrae]|uniref:Uncharacterized protein n=1 Tax=Sulfitobacter porphyrae TaxID=1246864 RepID=A0ABW2B2C1_9RHOB
MILLASDVVPGLRIVVAEPLVERNEALFDVMSAVVLGFSCWAACLMPRPISRCAARPGW